MNQRWTDRARDWVATLPDALADTLRDDAQAMQGFDARDTLPDAATLAWIRTQARCTACEACNHDCPLLLTAKLTRFAGPMELALRIVPSLPDLRDAVDLIATFDRCGGCTLCDQRCPQQIALTEIAARLRPAIQPQLDQRECSRQAQTAQVPHD